MLTYLLDFATDPMLACFAVACDPQAVHDAMQDLIGIDQTA